MSSSSDTPVTEKELYRLASSGKHVELRRLLLLCPDVNVNWENRLEHGWTALQAACAKGNHLAVTVLLVHPEIEVDHRDTEGWTPFMAACRYNQLECARVLLKDRRVDVLSRDDNGFMSISFVTKGGYIEIFRRWIASGKELSIEDSGTFYGYQRNTSSDEVKKLWNRFVTSPDLCQRKVRKELGWFDEVAAEILALVVFLCDGLLELKKKRETAPERYKRTRFFRIARKLPLEIQELLCRRAAGSSKSSVPQARREQAFADLGLSLWR